MPLSDASPSFSDVTNDQRRLKNDQEMAKIQFACVFFALEAMLLFFVGFKFLGRSFQLTFVSNSEGSSFKDWDTNAAIITACFPLGRRSQGCGYRVA